MNNHVWTVELSDGKISKIQSYDVRDVIRQMENDGHGVNPEMIVSITRDDRKQVERN